MKLLDFKKQLRELDRLVFQMEDDSLVPAHFHITEVGKISRHFIDCGGEERLEEKINLQLWCADDVDHRLSPTKLLDIIDLSEQRLKLDEHLNLEVEYQLGSIQKFNVAFRDGHFLLTNTQTDCLAKDKCGIPTEKPKVAWPQLSENKCCSPEDNCC